MIKRYDLNGEIELEKIKDLIEQIFEVVIADGKGIELNTSSRAYKLNAVKFSEEIVHQMSELNFLDARFEIRLTEAKSYSAQGKDDAEFYLSVNPGEPVRPLGDVASGGELSRIMLAIKTVLADEEDTPTLIFDEIDSGISGITAGRVGERLQLIGKSRQVICIPSLS